jgi:hypothetical protein
VTEMDPFYAIYPPLAFGLAVLIVGLVLLTIRRVLHLYSDPGDDRPCVPTMRILSAVLLASVGTGLVSASFLYLGGMGAGGDNELPGRLFRIASTALRVFTIGGLFFVLWELRDND